MRGVIVLSIGGLVARVASMAVVSTPGYTDAYYYADVATRLARGLGLTADFVWGPLELGPLPVASHRFWMPLASVLQAAGIAPLGGLIGDFRAAQIVLVIIAAFVPPAAYVCARALGATERAALVALVIVGLGGLFAPAWVTLDGFAVAALLGTLFFLAYARAAMGSWRAGAVAGLLVGLLYLARAEAALFGLAFVALVVAPRTRGAGIAGALVALAIGGAWLARDLSLGAPAGYVERTMLLTRYPDFFALNGATSTASAGDIVGARAQALVTNAATFASAFAYLLVVPLTFGIRGLWARPEVRAWSVLVVVVFAAESLVWTLHSVRGSYFHSLAAFYGFGVAIAVAGGERLLASRSNAAPAWTAGALLVVAVMSGFAVQGWAAAFGTGERAAALDAIPAGSFLALDAAAWRWISGRTVLFTPSEGIDAAACVANVPDPHATAIVLEAAHFPSYDDLYHGGARPSWLGPPIERGTVKIFPIVRAAPCAIGFGR